MGETDSSSGVGGDDSWLTLWPYPAGVGDGDSVSGRSSGLRQAHGDMKIEEWRGGGVRQVATVVEWRVNMKRRGRYVRGVACGMVTDNLHIKTERVVGYVGVGQSGVW